MSGGGRAGVPAASWATPCGQEGLCAAPTLPPQGAQAGPLELGAVEESRVLEARGVRLNPGLRHC